ncbi:hypothetical protein [Maritalea sp.]|jgi:hypothetical protein|uniref:hypothetical protein n=1 Tax=Maritalea sp. TaxID=2003361 RepID=UPI0039E236F4
MTLNRFAFARGFSGCGKQMLFKAFLPIDKYLSNFATLISQFAARVSSTKKLWSRTVFLLRCVFWLGIGFMVIKPFAFDQSSASALADEAIKRGTTIAIEQALSLDCSDITCEGIKTAALVTSLSTSLNGQLMNKTISAEVAPIPPPRPTRFN